MPTYAGSGEEGLSERELTQLWVRLLYDVMIIVCNVYEVNEIEWKFRFEFRTLESFP